MRGRGPRARISMLGATAAVVCGCGSAAAPGSAVPAACTGSVSVAVDPAAAADSNEGPTTELGARLAVDQANSSRLLGDCYIVFQPSSPGPPGPGAMDSAHASAAMSGLINDPSLVGVIGPFRSAAAVAELPVANRAGITMISPSNTDPGLTIEGSSPDVDTRSLRPTGSLTFFRICTTDLGEGRALARVATDVVKARRVYVFDDQTAYGKRLADQFQRYLPSQRGSDAHRVSVPLNRRDFRDDLARARQAGAELVFFGGASLPVGGALRRGMATAIPRAQYLGGETIVSPDFFAAAGSGAEGALGTVVAADSNQLDSARQFLNDYQVDFNSNPGLYSAAAYDAMNILLQALRRAIIAGGGHLPSSGRALREMVRSQVAATAYDGILGHTTFNDRGDTTNVLVTLEKASAGRWAYDRTLQFSTG